MTESIRKVYYGKACIGIFTMLLIGAPYLWSVFAAPVEAELCWTRAQTSTVFTISIIGMIAGGILGGYLTGKTNPAVTLRISGIAVVAGYALTVLFSGKIGFYVCYGVLASVGMGMAYNAAMAGFADSIPGRNGLFTGTMLMAYAFCSMLFGPLVNTAIHTLDWKRAFLLVGSISALSMIVASLFVFHKKQAAVPTEPAGLQPQDAEGMDIPPKQMMQRKTARRYLIWGTFAACSGLSIIGQAAQIIGEAGGTERLAMVCVSALGLANGLSRFAAGMLWDSLGWKKVMQLATMLSIVGDAGVVAGVTLHLPEVLFAGAMLAVASYGIGTPIGASFVRKFYGKTYFAMNYGLINLVGLSASLLGTTMVGTFRAATGTYGLPACILLLYSVMAVPILRSIKQP